MKLFSLSLVVTSSFITLITSTCCEESVQPPPTPVWPDKFSIQFYVYVEKYGPDWNSTGVLYYDWNIKIFRSDYIDWCLPLFDSGPGDFNSYTCSFVTTKDNMYFVNHTSSTWKDNDCCLFEKGLSIIPPDWMKNNIYNGTDIIDGVVVDKWWYPGTNDPLKPCYGYWNIRDGNIPVQFFGLSSLGPAILGYHDFKKGGHFIDVEIPGNCDEECKPPLTKMKSRYGGEGPPNWPSCE